MLVQVLIGVGLVVLDVGIVATFITAGIRGLASFGARKPIQAGSFRSLLALVATALWMLAALGLAALTWGVAFRVLGVFPTLEEAFYFSVVAFTTLGLGDVTLPHPWRLLSGLVAADGLLLFSLTTAFLIEVLRRVFVRPGDTFQSPDEGPSR